MTLVPHTHNKSSNSPMNPDLVRHVIAGLLLIAASVCGFVAYRKKKAFWREMNRPGGRANIAEESKAEFFKLLAFSLTVLAAVFAWPSGLSFR